MSEDLSLQKIRVDLILPSPFNTRIKIETPELNILVSSLQSFGQIMPIRVRKVEEGYELISGERRWWAAKKAGLKHLDAIVMEMSDEEVIMEQWAENENRLGLSDYAKALKLEQMLQYFNYSQTELAKKLSVSTPWVSRHLNMLSLRDMLPIEILHELKESQAREILSRPSKYWTELADELKKHYKTHNSLPSALNISRLPIGKDTIPVQETITPIPETPEKTLEKPSVEVDDEKVDLFLSKFRREDFHVPPSGIRDFISFRLTKEFGVDEAEAGRRINRFLRSPQPRREEPRPAAPVYKPSQAPTCRCPLCGREGADKQLLLANFVEDSVMAQKTLFEFVSDYLKK